MDSAPDPPRTRRHHLVVAGPGRAGTSFLVQFLNACGLDVGAQHSWVPRARAGFESCLLDGDAPYVVKDPWLWTYCDDIDLAEVAVDALVIPMRELMAAATSRIFQERMALAEGVWRTRPLTEVRGGADGGVVYSLNPTDQARILAVGFYRVIYWAVTNDIPLAFLDFPRLVQDRDYLVQTLWPWLEPYCTLEQANAAFSATAVASHVRVAKTEVEHDSSRTADEPDIASASRLDRDAMAALLNERIAATEKQVADIQNRLEHSEQSLAETQSSLAQSEQNLAEARSRLSEREDVLTEKERALGTAESRLAATQEGYEMLTRTVSWRATRPLRALRRFGLSASSRPSQDERGNPGDSDGR